jgi:uncharacterized protein
VGVNINTASKHLLSYVSGIGEAENIVNYRSENGPFEDRKQLKYLVWAKTFQRCCFYSN